jgi:hypothetical protein
MRTSPEVHAIVSLRLRLVHQAELLSLSSVVAIRFDAALDAGGQIRTSAIIALTADATAELHDFTVHQRWDWLAGGRPAAGDPVLEPDWDGVERHNRVRSNSFRPRRSVPVR